MDQGEVSSPWASSCWRVSWTVSSLRVMVRVGMVGSLEEVMNSIHVVGIHVVGSVGGSGWRSTWSRRRCREKRVCLSLDRWYRRSARKER
jgi:hypothetical protein